jgi:molybdopterin-containing oxidoreductase family iron-sulfur binding subunit
VQRISEAKITAKNEKRALVDGDVKVACQSACAMGAITFGDITDSNSEVSKAKSLTQDYALLKELNTLPRTTYLAKFRNPHPDLIDPSKKNNEISVGHH